MDDKVITLKRWIPRFINNCLQFTNYVLIRIKQQNTSKVLNILKNHNPFHTFLKRVNKPSQKQLIDKKIMEILVCHIDDQQKQELLGMLQQFTVEGPIDRKLPKYAPITKQQYKQWSQIWPINFSQNQLSKQLNITQNQRSLLQELYLSVAKHPYQYILFQTNKSQFAQILITQSGSCQQGTIDHPIMRMLSAWPSTQIFKHNSQFNQNNPKSSYYYLTGLKLYVRKPLCGMCSMALVHSRLLSIYLDTEPTQDMERIMNCHKLNHQITIIMIKNF